MMEAGRQWRRWLALGASLIAAACGGGSDSPAPAPAPAQVPGSGTAEVKWVADYMRDWYLWSEHIGNPDLTALETAEQALEALRYRPIDRFSYVDASDRYSAFFD
ncbi:MAG TPA: hypothetical protein VM491_02625, partial [Burkholderiaceae bacterium]|nr:hypothetical protein [Burkholderiaceae bacterium]